MTVFLQRKSEPDKRRSGSICSTLLHMDSLLKITACRVFQALVWCVRRVIHIVYLLVRYLLDDPLEIDRYVGGTIRWRDGFNFDCPAGDHILPWVNACSIANVARQPSTAATTLSVWMGVVVNLTVFLFFFRRIVRPPDNRILRYQL
jgi:hypothetical protein